MEKKRGLAVRRTRRAGEAGRADLAGGVSREISAGEFKARCLAIMDDVRDRGGEYVITKRGAPVAKLVPFRQTRRRLLGSMKGTVTTLGVSNPWVINQRGVWRCTVSPDVAGRCVMKKTSHWPACDSAIP